MATEVDWGSIVEVDPIYRVIAPIRKIGLIDDGQD